MNENVNLYELMTAFWKENEYESFSPGQICLYFFLLNRANSRRWNMPIKCETTYASRTIGIPHSAVLDAREGLYRRGLIKYTNGSGRSNPPLYYLILDPKEWEELPMENPGNKDKNDSKERGQKTPQQKPMGTPQEKHIENYQVQPIDTPQEKHIVSPSESPQPYNIKNEKSNIKDEIEISELEKIFLSDFGFQDEVIKNHSDKSIAPEFIQNRIKDFFSFLRSKNLNKREEKECKKHFINWFNKNLNNPQYGNQSSLRRPSDVTATSPKDYDGAF